MVRSCSAVMARSNLVSNIGSSWYEAYSLANIGDCVLNGHTLTDATARNDVRSVGLVMVELMEPETIIRSPAQTNLAHPEVWKDESGIKDFLSATKTQSLEILKKVRE